MDQPKIRPPPSSGTSGFFQTPPVLVSSFEEDETLKRIFRFYLPGSTQQSISPDLTRFSNLVLTPKIRNWCTDAERNVPYVKHYDSFGRRIDELITTSGWQELQKLGQAEGIVALGHDVSTYQQYARVYQFIKYHIWAPWNAGVTCPSAMTDGAAKMLERQLNSKGLGEEQRRVFETAHSRLLSRDPENAWTSGQWMTERPGGSDVQNTETQASLPSAEVSRHGERRADSTGNPLGPISISGFKWFSSATDANTTVLLAAEAEGGISAFFAPTRARLNVDSTETELNGIQIQRLKTKLGTRPLPTAELILSDMRAWRVGKPGQGVKEISTVLNITRLHNAVSAVGSLGRGLAISRAFSKVRKVRGKLLMDTPVHVRTLAEQHVEYRAMMHLSFYTAGLLGLSETAGGQSSNQQQQSPCESSGLTSAEDVPHLLRLLTPLAKMLTAKAAIAGLAECMESLGGVGYLENEDPALNVARLFRDANVLSIWEGTTNIMADDVLRIVKGSVGPAVLAALDRVVSPALERWEKSQREDWAEAVRTTWKGVQNVISQQSREELGVNGRALSKDLGWIICSVLLAEDALGDGDEVSIAICSRWISRNAHGRVYDAQSPSARFDLDRTIVFGAEQFRQTARL